MKPDFVFQGTYTGKYYRKDQEDSVEMCKMDLSMKNQGLLDTRR